jgi:DNA-directed RNA polymerase II subunit RPB1
VRFRNALKLKNPKTRLNVVYNICKTKTICEGGDELDTDEPTKDNDRPRHGGCGGYQPHLKKDGMKITAEFKQVKDNQEEGVEKKQVLTAEKVRTFLSFLTRARSTKFLSVFQTKIAKLWD